MTKYTCGHEVNTIIVTNDYDVLAKYRCWKDSVGFDGDKTRCFDCYCGEVK